MKNGGSNGNRLGQQRLDGCLIFNLLSVVNICPPGRNWVPNGAEVG